MKGRKRAGPAAVREWARRPAARSQTEDTQSRSAAVLQQLLSQNNRPSCRGRGGEAVRDSTMDGLVTSDLQENACQTSRTIKSLLQKNVLKHFDQTNFNAQQTEDTIQPSISWRGRCWTEPPSCPAGCPGTLDKIVPSHRKTNQHTPVLTREKLTVVDGQTKTIDVGEPRGAQRGTQREPRGEPRQTQGEHADSTQEPPVSTSQQQPC